MNFYTNDEKALIWLDSLNVLEYKLKRALIEIVASPSEILFDFENLKEKIGQVIGIDKLESIEKSFDVGINGLVIDTLESKDIKFITFLDDRYPEEFLVLDLPPIIVYYRGNIDLLKSKKKFSIVGSRKTLPQILSITKEITEDLIDNGATIITGIADGIDTAVINAGAMKGKVISVLPSGFDLIYPSSNESLVNTLAENSLVITEFNPSVRCQGYLFLLRNRLIATLGKGALICSGEIKSGGMLTAGYVLEYGKEIFAIPYSPGISSGIGCNNLIKNGAKLIESAQEILDELGWSENIKKRKVILSKEEKTLLKILKNGINHIDKIVESSGKNIQDVSAILTIMEIKGLVSKESGNLFKANS